jgi:hypothetical protein
MVALPPPRHNLPAANWEEDLMPERGPAQFLLHFLQARPSRGWRIGLAVALVAALAMLPGEESLYVKAKAGLAQSLRQAAWEHALAGEPAAKPWPWEHSTPAVSTVVPRLGLSAAIHCDASLDQSVKVPGRREQPLHKSTSIGERDPHLARGDNGFAQNADAVSVTDEEAFAERDDDDRLWEPGAPPPAPAPLAHCSPLESSGPGALHLMIEAIQGNVTTPTEIERKL